MIVPGLALAWVAVVALLALFAWDEAPAERPTALHWCKPGCSCRGSIEGRSPR